MANAITRTRLATVVVVVTTGLLASSCTKQSVGGQQSSNGEILFSGMGSLHHQITTSNLEAQRFFDQGLTFVYAFNFQEASRSFEQSAQLDAISAMPLWGIALAASPHYNGTDEINPQTMRLEVARIKTAQQRASTGPENERDYVQALAERFNEDPNLNGHELAHNYARAMRALHQKYPDDPDAAVLYAESLMNLHRRRLWTNDGQATADSNEISSVLEGVLRRWPDHIGANHFYIHVMEASPFPNRAMSSARRLEMLVPAAGHLVHMPSHIYVRTGDYSAAVKSNEDAIAADKLYLSSKIPNNSAYVVGYAEHNLLFLTYATEMEGDYETCIKTSRQLESDARAAVSGTPAAEVYLVTAMLVPVRFGRSEDVLSLPVPDPRFRGLSLFWHYARGSILAAQGNGKEADKERDSMETVYRQLQPGPAFGMLPNTWETLFELANNSLLARISESRGDISGAIDHWRAAVIIEDQMIYHEPPDWYYPVRESLGAALLRNRRPRDAERVFREDLTRTPSNPRSLLGLSTALRDQGKYSDAQTALRLFKANWRGAISGLNVDDTW